MNKKAGYNTVGYVIIVAEVLFICAVLLMFGKDMSYTGFVTRDTVEPLINVPVINETVEQNITTNETVDEIIEQKEMPIVEKPAEVEPIKDTPPEIRTTAGCIDPSEDLVINSDKILCSGTFPLADSDTDGAIQIGASDVVVTCNNTFFRGNNITNSAGILVGAYSNVSIINCSFSSYFYGIRSTSTSTHDLYVSGGTHNIYRVGTNASVGVSSRAYENVTVRNITFIGIGAGAFNIVKSIDMQPTAGVSQRHFLIDEIYGRNIKGITVGGVITESNTVTNVTISNVWFNQTGYYGILGGASKDLTVYGGFVGFAGGDSLSPRGNNSHIYNNYFDTAGHKNGIDAINSDRDLCTEYYNHSWHDNYFTSSGTNNGNISWVSSSYFDYLNNDGDLAIAIRGVADITSYNNRFINLQDNDTTGVGTRGYGIDQGDCSRNILIYNETFINVSGPPVSISVAKNVTIRDSYFCHSNNTRYPYDIAIGAGSSGGSVVPNNSSTVTLINNTKCSVVDVDGKKANLTYYFWGDTTGTPAVINVTIMTNATTKLVTAGATKANLTLNAVGGYNDLLSSSGTLAAGNFTTYKLNMTGGQTYYITNIDGTPEIIDDLAPEITVYSPIADMTYNNYSVLINVSASDASVVDTIWYKWNNTLNYTYLGEHYMNFTTQSSKNITVYANDTYNNIGARSVVFYIVGNPVPVLSNVTITDALNCSASVNKLANMTIEYYLDETLNNTVTFEANNSFSTTTTRYNGTWYCNITANDGTNTTIAGSNTIIINETENPPVSLALTGVSLNDALNCSASVNKLANMTIEYYLDETLNNTVTFEANNSFSTTTTRYNGTWYCNITANDGTNTTIAVSSTIIINETEQERSSGRGGGSGSSTQSGTIPLPESEPDKKNESENITVSTESVQNATPEKAGGEPAVIEQPTTREPVSEQPESISSGIWRRNKSVYITAIILFIIAVVAIILTAKPIHFDPRIQTFTVKALQSGYSYDAVRNSLRRHFPEGVIDHHFHLLRSNDVKPIIRFDTPVERTLPNEGEYITRLKTYIAHQRTTGFKDKHIKKVLLSNGYPKSTVEKAFGG